MVKRFQDTPSQAEQDAFRAECQAMSHGELLVRLVYWAQRVAVNSETDRIKASFALRIAQELLLERLNAGPSVLSATPSVSPTPPVPSAPQPA